MLQNPVIKKRLIIAYIVFLVFGFFYIRGIVKDTSVDVGEKSEEEVNTEVKETIVTLSVKNGNQLQEYKYQGKNVDSIMDMFERLRANNNFKYQVIEYTYGTELESVNGIKASSNEKWKLYDGEKDITNNIHDELLVDGKSYLLTRSAMQQ